MVSNYLRGKEGEYCSVHYGQSIRFDITSRQDWLSGGNIDCFEDIRDPLYLPSLSIQLAGFDEMLGSPKILGYLGDLKPLLELYLEGLHIIDLAKQAAQEIVSSNSLQEEGGSCAGGVRLPRIKERKGQTYIVLSVDQQSILKEARKTARLSLAYVANITRAGSAQQVCNYENGAGIPKHIFSKMMQLYLSQELGGELQRKLQGLEQEVIQLLPSLR